MGLFNMGGASGAAQGVGKATGGGLTGGIGSSGISPLSIVTGVADTIGGLFSGATMGRFDYGKADYTKEEAGQFAADKAKALMSGIPLAGGLLGGIGGFIAKKIAENRAEPILENREAKLDQIAQYKMDKLKENRFFRNSDLFNQGNKSLFNTTD